MAREQAELWKTRDNGGKAAWLFIGVLSSVYWVSDVITDDELAVLIMRACSSRNLFVKHHDLLSSAEHMNDECYLKNVNGMKNQTKYDMNKLFFMLNSLKRKVQSCHWGVTFWKVHFMHYYVILKY